MGYDDSTTNTLLQITLSYVVGQEAGKLWGSHTGQRLEIFPSKPR